eukprot:g3578.t1
MPKRDGVSLRTFREEETRRRDFDDFEEACERNLEPEAFADESTLHHRPILSQSTEQQLEDYPGHSMGDLVERLFEALELGNVSLLQRLIELSVKMHAPANSRRSLAEIARLDIWARRKQDDRSLLHHACYCDRNGVVRFLLGDTYRDSRSVNTIDSEYMTPLHIVCSRDDKEAPPSLVLDDGHRPLWKIESFIAKDTRPAKEWERTHSAFQTHYVQRGGSMDNDPNVYECERGCGFESQSRSDVECHEVTCDPNTPTTRILTKWKGISCLHCTWETRAALERMAEKHELAKLNRFLDATLDSKSFAWKRELAARSTIERIVAEEEADAGVDCEADRMVLVKWSGDADYCLCTWERKDDLRVSRFGSRDLFEEKMNDYRARCRRFDTIRKRETKKHASSKNAKDPYGKAGMSIYYRPSFSTSSSSKRDNRRTVAKNSYFPRSGSSLPPYDEATLPGCERNGLKLRDYQVRGVNWLLRKWISGTNVCLADEMGLGKTVQSAALVDHIARRERLWGTYLVVVPLSTAINWQREFDRWTNLSTVILKGSRESRERFKAFETESTTTGAEGKPRPRFDVLIATYEMVQLEIEWLRQFDFRLLIVDEAHRLKSRRSKLLQKIRLLKFGGALLLTGTPLQNSVAELWPLLNLLDPETFEDLDTFLEKYDVQAKDGGGSDLLRDDTGVGVGGVDGSTTSVTPLIRLLQKYMLRRMKDDVERRLLPKRETVVEVELTRVQKKYYRALYQENGASLVRGYKRSMMNVAMELRKCCNHPFLLDGVEKLERNAESRGFAANLTEVDALVRTSGKMTFLDKLLPKLKSSGHRVLVFSQFVSMLNILEDYLVLRGHAFERIDGGVKGSDRQRSIDNFNRTDSPSFVFLISTKAGGVGINLTSADTVIIYDSDWNPQNDLQAMSRCHRIGQDKQVVVYRLLARKSYEYGMFEAASLKLGLDQAVLQGVTHDSDSSRAMSKEEMQRLLRHGAYHALKIDEKGDPRGCNASLGRRGGGGGVDGDDDDDDDDDEGFFDATVDEILERRTRVVKHDGGGVDKHGNAIDRKRVSGGVLSKATFFSDQYGSIEIDDENFWAKVLGADAVEQRSGDDEILSLERHERSSRSRAVDYTGDKYKSFYRAGDDDDDGGSKDECDDKAAATSCDQGERERASGRKGGKRKTSTLQPPDPRALAIVESLGVERNFLVSRRGTLLPWGGWDAVARALEGVAEFHRDVDLVAKQLAVGDTAKKPIRPRYGRRRRSKHRQFLRSSCRRSLLLFSATVRTLAAAHEATMGETGADCEVDDDDDDDNGDDRDGAEEEGGRPDVSSDGGRRGVETKSGDDLSGATLVGCVVRKHFPKFGFFTGTVSEYYAPERLYVVKYEDGDSEDFSLDELAPILLGEEGRRLRKHQSKCVAPPPPSLDDAFAAVHRLEGHHEGCRIFVRDRKQWHRQFSDLERAKTQIIGARRVLREVCECQRAIGRSLSAEVKKRIETTTVESLSGSDGVAVDGDKGDEIDDDNDAKWLKAEKILMGQFLADPIVWRSACAQPTKRSKIIHELSKNAQLYELVTCVLACDADDDADDISCDRAVWRDVLARAEKVEIAHFVKDWTPRVDDRALVLAAQKYGRDPISWWSSAGDTLGFEAKLKTVDGVLVPLSAAPENVLPPEILKRLRRFLRRRVCVVVRLYSKSKEIRRRKEIRSQEREQKKKKQEEERERRKLEKRERKRREIEATRSRKQVQKRELAEMRQEERWTKACMRLEAREKRRAQKREAQERHKKAKFAARAEAAAVKRRAVAKRKKEAAAVKRSAVAKRKADAKKTTPTKKRARRRAKPSSVGSRSGKKHRFRTVVPSEDTRIRLVQENPKRGMSATRYDKYKSATTLCEYYALGGSRADARFDIARDYLEVMDDAYNVQLSLDRLVASVVGASEIAVKRWDGKTGRVLEETRKRPRPAPPLRALSSLSSPSSSLATKKRQATLSVLWVSRGGE